MFIILKIGNQRIVVRRSAAAAMRRDNAPSVCRIKDMVNTKIESVLIVSVGCAGRTVAVGVIEVAANCAISIRAGGVVEVAADKEVGLRISIPQTVHNFSHALCLTGPAHKCRPKLCH